MEMAWIILKQTLTMGLYMAAGFALYKCGKITQEGSRTLAQVLIFLIIPVVMIRSFCVECTPERLSMLGWSFLLATIAMFLSMAVASIIYRKHPIDRFAATFSNAGFIGIPLVTAALGSGVVFYLCGFLMWINILQWTWGSAVIKREKMSFNPKTLFCNIFMFAAALGLFLFFTNLGVRLPSVVANAMEGIANLNGPIAMLIMGVYLAQADLRKLFITPRLYAISAVRMWLIPLLTLLIFAVLPAANDIRMTLLISASAPVGANVAVYAQLYDADYPYACQTVALSTVASIVMLPLFILLATFVLGM